jgi:hypothetical protein
MAQSVFKAKKRGTKKKSVKGYAYGGLVKTNQKTIKAKGAGAATRGYDFKV